MFRSGLWVERINSLPSLGSAFKTTREESPTFVVMLSHSLPMIILILYTFIGLYKCNLVGMRSIMNFLSADSQK
jgi:hypothetical protein